MPANKHKDAQCKLAEPDQDAFRASRCSESRFVGGKVLAMIHVGFFSDYRKYPPDPIPDPSGPGTRMPGRNRFFLSSGNWHDYS
jgi:hypothetical protein